MIVEIVFLVAAILILLSATMVLRAKELVHSAVWLAVMLLGVAGIFLTLGGEFLATVQVLVYVGAVITLILFTIMLTVPPERAVGIAGIELPPGVTIESIEEIQQSVPRFTGEGPYKDLEGTNPRRPLKEPASLYGVALADNENATEFTPKNKDKKEAK